MQALIITFIQTYTGILLCLCSLLLGACIWYIYQLHTKLKQHTQTISQLKKSIDLQHQHTHFSFAESKLSSHLIKNILNSIQSHVYQAYYSMDKLSSVLDYIVYEGKRSFVSPEAEIQFAKDCIDMYKVKMSPLFNLQSKFLIDSESETYTSEVILPFCTIDLIENAFKFTDLHSETACISIQFTCNSQYFELRVSNTVSKAQPLKKGQTGFGLSQLNDQLHLTYGKYATLETHLQEEVHFAQLRIDLEHFILSQTDEPL